MNEILIVSLGAIVGANTRFKIYNMLASFNLRKNYLVLIINTFACFSLGFSFAILEHFNSFKYSYQLILFFSIGFLGTLSTFSSFVYDLYNLCSQLKFFRAFKLFIISTFLGIISFALGFLLGN